MQNNAPASPPASPPPSDPSPPPTEETEESDDAPPSINFGNMFGSNMLPFANMFENDPELMHELGELSNEPEFASIREEFAQEGPSALMRFVGCDFFVCCLIVYLFYPIPLFSVFSVVFYFF